ncbi:MAG TPA: methyltransferase [Pyrinomonadaceae bacterium]|nr:methyltransferase [Pyrinomonadaceae bacterium]
MTERSEFTPPPEAVLMQMLFGGLMQQCISLAAQLGLADLLAEKPQTAAELAARTGSHEPSLYRVIRVLASVGIFSEGDDGKFGLTPMGGLLRTDAPNSLRDFAIMQSQDWLWRNFAALPYSVETGNIAHDKVHGIDNWTFLSQNAELEAVFNRAMTNLSLSAVPPILQAYDFSDVRKLVDIAGGHGFLLASVLKANPEMKGVLFDQPSVVAGAEELLGREGVRDRVELASGDFFAAVPDGADAYIMKHIIHDWNDAQCVDILRNIRNAMDERGKVLICEMVVPEGNEPSPSKILDIQMMVNLSGKERTAKEFEDLLKRSGFRLTRIVPTMSPFSIVEGQRSA